MAARGWGHVLSERIESGSAAGETFLAAVLTQLRRDLLGPWPGEPSGAVVVRCLAFLPCPEPDTVVVGLELVVHGVAVADSFEVPGWPQLAVGSPSALGRALAAEIRMHLQEGVAGARVGGKAKSA